jgi:hypothetical protein
MASRSGGLPGSRRRFAPCNTPDTRLTPRARFSDQLRGRLGRLAAGDGAQDDERVGALGDGGGEGGVRGIVGVVLGAGEEADEGSALMGHVVADRAAEDRVAGLQRVQDRAGRRGTRDVELDFA